MKNHLIAVLLFYCFLACTSREEKAIHYGSNNGKYVVINNNKIYYEEYGQGTPLLLLSGGGLTRSIKDFEKCIPELAKHFRVIAPDTPGQGKSEQLDTITYEVLMNVMSIFIDSMKVDSVYIMGWSDGGIESILLAAKRQDKVKRIVAVGANNGLRGAALPPGIPLDSVKPWSLDEFEKQNKTIIEVYQKIMPRDWRNFMDDCQAMWYGVEYFPNAVYNDVKAKTMIVLGDHDDISLEHGIEMHRAIENSQFCVLPNTTHDVFSEKPELISQIAIEFFEN